jgi:hypothetical protein
MDSKPIRDSREAGVRPFVLFCAIIASLGTFNSGMNTVCINASNMLAHSVPQNSNARIEKKLCRVLSISLEITFVTVLSLVFRTIPDPLYLNVSQ